MRRDGRTPRLEIVRPDPTPNPQAQHPFRMLDQVNALVEAREADPDLGFMARLMALCSLPRKNPGNGQYQYVRVNGPYTLILSRTGKCGLPFGIIPRLLLAWLSTEAVRTQSSELILGKSLADFMRTLGIYNSGGHPQTRLKNQMDRLFNASVRLIYEHDHGEASVHSAIADRTEFWWDKRKPDEPVLFESKIELGEKFFQEILHHPVPLDMNILKAMKRSPLGLDLYLWLTYRTFSLDAPKRLSWPILYRQFGSNPAKAIDRVTVDSFRKDCLRELTKIQTAWPGLRYRIERGHRHEKTGGLVLLPSAPQVPPLKLFP